MGDATAGLGIGTATNIIGGTMQAIAASQARRAMEHAYRREIQLQSRFRNQAFTGLEQQIPLRGVEQARTDIAAGAAHRRQNYAGANQSSFVPGGQGQTQRDLANYDLMGNLRAQVGGYSDWGLENLIRQIRSQEKLNQISNFAKGWSDVYPAKLQDVQHSSDELAFWGNFIQGIGGGAQSYGQLFGNNSQPSLGPQHDY